MGLVRKAINLGPMLRNNSKSGIGLSFGVKDTRAGAGPEPSIRSCTHDREAVR